MTSQKRERTEQFHAEIERLNAENIDLRNKSLMMESKLRDALMTAQAWMIPVEQHSTEALKRAHAMVSKARNQTV